MPLCKYEAVQHVQGAQGVGCRLRDGAFLSRSSSFFSVALSRFHFHFLLFFAFPLHFILESYHSPFYSFIHNTSIYIKKGFFLVCIKRPVNPQVNSNRPFRTRWLSVTFHVDYWLTICRSDKTDLNNRPDHSPYIHLYVIYINMSAVNATFLVIVLLYMLYVCVHAINQ